jgi:hypothetical protein
VVIRLVSLVGYAERDGGGIYFGHNANSGLSISEPFQTIGYALEKIYADSLHPHTVYLTNGVYSKSVNGELFPINIPSYVSLVGESQEKVVLDAEGKRSVIFSTHNHSVTINNMTITGGSAGKGAGVYSLNSNLNLENVIIRNNNANLGSGVYGFKSSINVVNATIVQNNGIGIFSQNSLDAKIVNTILWNNISSQIFFLDDQRTHSISIAYSDIKGGSSGISTNNINLVNWQEGNIEVEPLFADTVNYYLDENSPAVDAGDPNELYNDPEDPNNPGFALRPALGSIRNDMGAYGGPGTAGRDTVFTGLKNENVNIPLLPKEFALYQNYPNPFNPETNITFQLPENNHVKIIIYNTVGQEIKTLTDKNYPPGNYDIRWDGKNSFGNIVSSGLYFYHIKAGSFNSIRKMLLMK